MAPVKAQLEVIRGSNKLAVTVHFNPQSLHVSYSTSGTAGKINGVGQIEKQEAAAQQTGFGASLSIELLFDSSQSGEDVRGTTLKIAQMIRPALGERNADNSALMLPIVRFSWGTFLFNGNIVSMTETLDFFSEQGVPLRATVNLSMNEVALDRDDGNKQGTATTTAMNPQEGVGTTPLTLSQSGDTLQDLTGRAGQESNWKAIGSANAVENPRIMQPGTVLNLNVRK